MHPCCSHSQQHGPPSHTALKMWVSQPNLLHCLVWPLHHLLRPPLHGTQPTPCLARRPQCTMQQCPPCLLPLIFPHRHWNSIMCTQMPHLLPSLPLPPLPGTPFPPLTIPECMHMPHITQHILSTGLMAITCLPNLTYHPHNRVI